MFNIPNINLNPITTIGDSVSNVLEKVDGLVTSKEEPMNQDVKLAEVRNELASIQKDIILGTADLEKQIVAGKTTALQAEMTGNVLQRNWRPIVMLSFATVVMYQFFFRDLFNSLFCAGLPLIDMPDHFWTLLEVGIGGYLAGRSLEKIAPNVTKTIMDAKESRRITEEVAMKRENQQTRMELRHERKMERKEKREARRDERQEKREEIHQIALANQQSASPQEAMSKKEMRKLKRKQRREAGKLRIKHLFNS